MSVISPADFLGIVQSLATTPEAHNKMRLGTVDADYESGNPRVTFDGESTLSGRTYACIDSYAPNPGDRVLLLMVGTTWLVMGSVGGSAGRTLVGEVKMTASANTPDGWLVCNGQAVSRTTYRLLFEEIGTTYGAGNGTTTFNVPDFGGRAPMGAGQGDGLTNRALGAQVGAETHTLTPAQTAIRNHSHTGTFVVRHSASGSNNPGNGLGTTAGSPPPMYATNTGSGFTNMNGVNVGNPTGGQVNGSAHNNMQPSLAVSFLIFTGV